MDKKTTRTPKEKKPVVLTPEEYAAVDAAQASYEQGEEMTFDEAMELARERTRVWMSVTHKDRQAA